VVAVARRGLGTRRVGHAGTLDPFATGLLPLLIGRATRLMPYLSGLTKRYVGTLRLGEATTTDDRTGEPMLASSQADAISDDRLGEAMDRLTGCLTQLPPAFSAKKVGGKPAYRRARRGEAVVLRPVTVEVFRFAVLARDGRDVEFEAQVGGGTYIRALARDLGAALGCGAHLRALRRVAVGPWSIDHACAFADLQRGAVVIADVLAAVSHLAHRVITAEERHAVGHGRPIDGACDGTAVALLHDGALIAVATPHAGRLKPRVVLEPL